jgi:hypothetical protein
MFMNVLDVVAKPKRVHMLNVENWCECASDLSHPFADGLSFKSGCGMSIAMPTWALAELVFTAYRVAWS